MGATSIWTAYKAFILKHEPVLGLIGTTLGTLIAAIQGSALILALPDLLSELGANLLSLLWVLISYILCTTVLVPVFGRISDLYPIRRRSFVAGVLIFTADCLVLGLAPVPKYHCWDMVIYRVIQGVGGSLMFANGTPIITELYAKTGRLSMAIGINQIAIASGLVIGPLIGGVLIKVSWRWVYLFNVPVGGVIFLFCLLVLHDTDENSASKQVSPTKLITPSTESPSLGTPTKDKQNTSSETSAVSSQSSFTESPHKLQPLESTPSQTVIDVKQDKKPQEENNFLDSNSSWWQRFKQNYLSYHFDTFGAFLFISTFTIGLALIGEASFNDINTGTIIALTIITAALASLLIFIELNTKFPLLKVRLFMNMNFTIPLLAGTLAAFARSLVIFGTIFFFQGPYGKDAEEAGYMIIPLGIALLLFSFVAGVLADKIGLWAMCVVGPIICAAGVIGLCFITDKTNYVAIAASLAVVGVGAGIFNSPNTTGIMSSLQPNERGAGASLNIMTANFCQMLCITIIFKVMLGSVTEAELVQLFVYGGAGLEQSAIDTLVKAYHASMWIGVGLLLASFVCTFTYLNAPYRRKVREAVELP